MSEAFLERRRAPRVQIPGDRQVGVPVALTVRLMDISASGVLLSSSQKMVVGQRARLHTTLGSEPLNVEVEVRRVGEAEANGAGRGRYRIGAVFHGMDEAGGRSVRHFLQGDAV